VGDLRLFAAALCSSIWTVVALGYSAGCSLLGRLLPEAGGYGGPITWILLLFGWASALGVLVLAMLLF
jgi:hypothetical protein